MKKSLSIAILFAMLLLPILGVGQVDTMYSILKANPEWHYSVPLRTSIHSFQISSGHSEALIRFSFKNDSLYSEYKNLDSSANIMVNEVAKILQWRLDEKQRIIDSLHSIIKSMQGIVHFSSSANTSIPPSQGYRESWCLVNGYWTNNKNGHFWLKWFNDEAHSSMWVQNYDMTDSRFRQMADYISSDGVFWADCCAISTDTTGLSSYHSFRVMVVDKGSSYDKMKWNTFDPTMNDFEDVKKKIFEFFVKNPGK